MNPIKFLVLLVVASLSVFVSYALGTAVARRYFFDRIYYQKSPEFGYATTDDEWNALAVERMNGLPLLTSTPSVSMSGATTQSHAYTIAVIGDSLVWGMGVRTRERFSELLAGKLGRYRPTHVYTLGKPGDNFLDHLSKTVLLEKNAPPDLYIFIVFTNDILLWDTARYPSPLGEAITEKCRGLGPYVYDGNFPAPPASMDSYYDRVLQAWENPANLCLISEGVAHLPRNAIYLIVDNHSETHDYDRYAEFLRGVGLSVQSISRNSPGIDRYRRYFDNPQKYFSVSRKENHPSTLANRMFADYLFYEIVNNARWGFVQR